MANASSCPAANWLRANVDSCGLEAQPICTMPNIQRRITRRITSYNVCYTKLLRMLRRSSWHYFHPDAALRARQVADWMGELLGWPDSQRSTELQRYRTATGCQVREMSSPWIFSQLRNDQHRITSYNVCYTKLLRNNHYFVIMQAIGFC